MSLILVYSFKEDSLPGIQWLLREAHKVKRTYDVEGKTNVVGAVLNFSSAIIDSQHFLICFFNCYGGGGGLQSLLGEFGIFFTESIENCDKLPKMSTIYA